MTSKPMLLTMPILLGDDAGVEEDEEGEEGERSAFTPSETRQLESRPCHSRRMSDVVEMRALRTPVMGDRSV